MVAFYADVNFHIAIVRGLVSRGIDVLTAQSDGYGTRSDEDLVDRATELGRVVVSHDQDMLIIGADRLASGILFGGVVYIAQNNRMIGRCIDDLELYARATSPERCANTISYLPY